MAECKACTCMGADSIRASPCRAVPCRASGGFQKGLRVPAWHLPAHGKDSLVTRSPPGLLSLPRYPTQGILPLFGGDVSSSIASPVRCTPHPVDYEPVPPDIQIAPRPNVLVSLGAATSRVRLPLSQGNWCPQTVAEARPEDRGPGPSWLKQRKLYELCRGEGRPGSVALASSPNPEEEEMGQPRRL
ncbi:hypothetical protein P7K49_033538 [Saguinus oedipus]|uniref:Uncharacterized protein n=1 Tax=Saguinus oedipus TaxID=9490 RepID=A0ABQ9TS79_SAGOE|nr:hypothetical protein P7K49_033538 [Saguinus oedipus]